jgi:hypothetical protein
MGRWAIAIVVTLAGLATPSHSDAAEADRGADEQQVLFDIPAQPLGAALEHFMEAAKVSVVVDSAEIAGRRSALLHGQFSAEGALRSLLVGTALIPRQIGDRAYTLDRLIRMGATQPLPRFIAYSTAIQQAVTNALCLHDETRPMHYRAVMRLWLSPGGTVTHVQLGDSTGSTSLDAAIGNALDHVRIGAPVPAGLPQPVKLAILPPAKPGDVACPPTDAVDQAARNLAR